MSGFKWSPKPLHRRVWTSKLCVDVAWMSACALPTPLSCNMTNFSGIKPQTFGMVDKCLLQGFLISGFKWSPNPLKKGANKWVLYGHFLNVCLCVPNTYILWHDKWWESNPDLWHGRPIWVAEWRRHWFAMPKVLGFIPKKFFMLRDNAVGSTQADIQARSTQNLLVHTLLWRDLGDHFTSRL